MDSLRSPQGRDLDAPTSPRTRAITEAFEPVPFTGEGMTFAAAFVQGLVDLGVREAWGISGGVGVPFFVELTRAGLQPVHFRHESGAVFAALEYSLASEHVAVVFATSGPGLTNALTGVEAARWDGGRVILVTGATSTEKAGRALFQDTSHSAMPMRGLFTSGGWFDYAELVTSPSRLPDVLRQLALGLQRKRGFVAHVSLPLNVQLASLTTSVALPRIRVSEFEPAANDVATAAAAIRDAKRVLVVVGFGARKASAEVRAFVERTGAWVVSTPRGKGVVDEDHPNVLGVSGWGGHSFVRETLRDARPDVVVVLGTRLGEGSTFGLEELRPSRAFVQVDLDPDAFALAHPETPTLGLVGDVSGVVQRLLAAGVDRGQAPPAARPRASLAIEPNTRVRPSRLMQAVQEVVIDGSDAIVMAEPGAAFVWTSHSLRFSEAGRFRMSARFGSMGQFTSGVVGAARARGRAVALVGDGAMLMQNEVSTAVSMRVPCVWVVLNDARYGLVDDGMQSNGFPACDLSIPPVDFAAQAASVGARGFRVEHEGQLESALREALLVRGPAVVDVWIDSSERPPLGDRNASLNAQATSGNATDYIDEEEF